MTTKTRTIPTFLVLAGLGVAAWMVLPSAITRYQDDGLKNVFVSAEWESPNRSVDREKIHVVVVTGKDTEVCEKCADSPFIRVYHLAPGTLVKITATQAMGKRLRCVINQKGIAPQVEKQIYGTGFVTCVHTVV